MDTLPTSTDTELNMIDHANVIGFTVHTNEIFMNFPHPTEERAKASDEVDTPRFATLSRRRMGEINQFPCSGQTARATRS
jgi:hypothetical protein